MAGPSPEPEHADDHDRRRIRAARRVLVAGLVLGLLAAVGLALLGLPGSAGLSAILVGVALGSAGAALHLGVLALVDEAQGRPVARGRPLRVVAYLFGAVLLLVLAAGATQAGGP